MAMKSGMNGRSGGPSQSTQPARFEGGMGLAGQQSQDLARTPQPSSSSSSSSRLNQHDMSRQDSGSNGSGSARTVNGYGDRTQVKSPSDVSRTAFNQQRPLVADRKAPPPPRAPQQADPIRNGPSQSNAVQYPSNRYPEEKLAPKPTLPTSSPHSDSPSGYHAAVPAITALQPAKKTNQGPPPAPSSGAAGRTEAERTAPTPPAMRTAERRISTMSEAQIMDKLRSVVSKEDPSLLYSKIKKVGQG